jgi:hypothetical protein
MAAGLRTRHNPYELYEGSEVDSEVYVKCLHADRNKTSQEKF